MKTLTIDFGHGGKDAGAINPKYGLNEKSVVLSLKNRLLVRAKKVGIKLLFTRQRDVFLSLSQRAQIANDKRSDLFFSLHCNAANKRAHGIECFHYRFSKRSEEAAKVCQAQLMKRFPDHNDRGVKGANFHVLRETNMRAVLWELEFIDTDFGAKTLMDNEALDKYADAIIEAAVIILDVKDHVKPSPIKRAIGRACQCICPNNH